LIQEQRKDMEESIAACQRALDLSPHSPRMHAALGRALALSNKASAASASLRDLESMAHTRYVSPFEFAVIRLALDQDDAGFKWLAIACEHRAFDLLTLKVDPRFQPFKDDPRLQAVIQQVGLL
jgi:serine/threonine-protein kinase